MRFLCVSTYVVLCIVVVVLVTCACDSYLSIAGANGVSKRHDRMSLLVVSNGGGLSDAARHGTHTQLVTSVTAATTMATTTTYGELRGFFSGKEHYEFTRGKAKLNRTAATTTMATSTAKRAYIPLPSSSPILPIFKEKAAGSAENTPRLTNKVDGPLNMFFCGDSTMNIQYNFVKSHLSALEDSQNGAVSLKYHQNSGGGCSKCDLPSMPEKRASYALHKHFEQPKGGWHVAYLNFGALHLMHTHPFRGWIYEPVERFVSPSADLAGWLNLEQWMLEELRNVSEMVPLVVVMLPPRICHSCFTRYYRQVLEQPTKFVQDCAAYLWNLTENTMVPSWVRSNLSYRLRTTQAERICTEGLLNAEGTDLLAERMRKVVNNNFPCRLEQKGMDVRLATMHQVCVLDAHALTTFQDVDCRKFTGDGLHYNLSIVSKQIELLEDFVKRAYGELRISLSGKANYNELIRGNAKLQSPTATTTMATTIATTTEKAAGDLILPLTKSQNRLGKVSGL